MIDYFWTVLTLHGNFEFLALLGMAAAKATFLLAFAALLCAIFRRFSAGTRHLLLTLSLCGSLLLPFLSIVKVWEVPILPAPISVSGASGSNESIGNVEVFEMPEARTLQQSAASFEASDGMRKKSEFPTNLISPEEPLPVTNTSRMQSPPQKNTPSLLPQLVNWALAVWVVGALLVLLRLLIGFTAGNFLVRRAARFDDPALNELFSSLLVELNLKNTVRLLRSERTLMPIVCGILRPVVLLPAEAQNWSEERLRIVLLHELTHIARRDCLTQVLAQTACAFYWFNPLVWHAARRLRVERERACDEFVLSVGTKPSAYAHHLLEIARLLRERSIFEWSQTTTVAMARQSQLEGRVLAILDKENGKDYAMSRLTKTSAVALVCVFLLTLAVVSPTAGEAQNFGNDSNAETAVEEEARQEPYLSLDTQSKSEAEIQDSNRQAKQRTRGKTVQEEKNILGKDNKPEHALSDTRNDREVEDVERNVVKDSLVAQPQPPANAPNSDSQSDAGVIPFINTGYRQERISASQDKSRDFIDEMTSAGFTNLSIDDLVKLKTHGVTADFVRSLRAYGFSNLTVREAANLRVQGVTPAYIEAMAAAGYRGLTPKDLTNARIHNITPEFIKKLQNAGYANLSIKQLTEFKIHNLTPEFIKQIGAEGYGELSAKELVSLRVHNVTPEFVRKARSRLGELTIKQLVSLKIAGIINDGFNEE